MLTGIILAGGQNHRMQGQSKALLPFGDSTLIVRQLRLMQSICSELIVVTNEPKPFLRLLDPEIRIITDFIPNRGPLGGMHAGLSLSHNRDVWVVGSDMPFVSAEAAALLQQKKHDGYDATMPCVQGGVYALHGVYDRSCAEIIWSVLRSGEAAITRLLKVIHWCELDETVFQQEGIGLEFVRSFGTHQEYTQLLSLLQDSSLSIDLPS